MTQYNKTYKTSKELQLAQKNYLANVNQIQTLNNLASSQSNKLPKA
jgi:C1A family cysteine protease